MYSDENFSSICNERFPLVGDLDVMVNFRMGCAIKHFILLLYIHVEQRALGSLYYGIIST